MLTSRERKQELTTQLSEPSLHKLEIGKHPLTVTRSTQVNSSLINPSFPFPRVVSANHVVPNGKASPLQLSLHRPAFLFLLRGAQPLHQHHQLWRRRRERDVRTGEWREEGKG